MRPVALIFASIFFAVGVVLAWLIASSTISWVEVSQEAEMEQAFYAGGIDWAEAEADGFLMTLRGDTDSEPDKDRAAKIARLIFGDNLVDETTLNLVEVVVVPPEPPFVEILKNGLPTNVEMLKNGENIFN